MKKTRITILLMLVSLLWLTFAPLAQTVGSVRAAPADTPLSSVFANTPPTIDGSIGFGEWSNAATIPFNHGYLTVLNDDIRLYVLINVTGDNIDSSTDYFWLSFDVDKNNAITANVDKNYGTVPSTGNMRYQFYLGPDSWTGLQPNTYSSRGKGFGCFFGDGSLSFSLFPFRLNCNRHRVFELAIDLGEINASPGSNVRMGFRAASDNPSFIDNFPANFSSDFSNLINVSLANSPYLYILPSPLADISLEANPIEITQAIQTRDNDLSLVADKTTAARVYADADNAPYSQLSKVYLYGSVGGVDLPGSPLAKLHYAPLNINRDTLSHTANFKLPAAWDNGTVNFSAKVADYFGGVDSSVNIPISFTPRDVPVVWIVPINTGTAMAPVLPSNSTIADQESAMEATYPVKDITFVRKDWSVIGPTTVNNTINDLNQYYNNVVIAWLITVLFTGNQPYALPDQIYGFTPSGGGISDPTWYNSGNGRVARGFLGTSLELTMAHEINHNLDRSLNGTWGRHVPNGCGAGGPDPSWPYLNDDIQETGFDTRGTWQDTATKETAVNANFPDFMSYCQSGKLPTKWISPYRWTNLFSVFPAPALRAPEIINDIVPTFYVSGQVNVDGTGSLNPVLNQYGLPANPDTQGPYAVSLYDGQDQLMDQISFPGVFEDPEGEPLDSIFFNYQFPADPGVQRIVLTKDGEPIAEAAASPNAPTVNITSPSGGETWAGTGLVEWTAEDLDGDPLSFTIQYSPDGGSSWYPVAADLTETSYEVNTATLPGGTDGMIKVIASDGFLNGEDVTDASFTVEDNAPNAAITAPEAKSYLKPGQSVVVLGTGDDPEDGPLSGDQLVWTVDGDPAGTGDSVELSDLSFGPHTVTLTVVDSHMNTSETSINILVGETIFIPMLGRAPGD